LRRAHAEVPWKRRAAQVRHRAWPEAREWPVEKVRAAHSEALDDSPFAQAVLAFAVELRSWTGTASELLGLLTKDLQDGDVRRGGWPKGATALGSKLRRFAPGLRAAGIEVVFAREGGKRPRRLLLLDRKNAGAAVTPSPIRQPGGRSGVSARGRGPSPGRHEGTAARTASDGRDSGDGAMRTQSSARAEESAGHAGPPEGGSFTPPPAHGPSYGTTKPEVFESSGGKGSTGATPLLDTAPWAATPPAPDPIEEEERRPIQEVEGGLDREEPDERGPGEGAA